MSIQKHEHLTLMNLIYLRCFNKEKFLRSKSVILHLFFFNLLNSKDVIYCMCFSLKKQKKNRLNSIKNYKYQIIISKIFSKF